jgi:hypothetical protein
MQPQAMLSDAFEAFAQIFSPKLPDRPDGSGTPMQPKSSISYGEASLCST